MLINFDGNPCRFLTNLLFENDMIFCGMFDCNDFLQNRKCAFYCIRVAKIDDFHDYLKESEGEILNISRDV